MHTYIWTCCSRDPI